MYVHVLVGIQTFDLKLRPFLNTSCTDSCVLLSETLWKSDAVEFDKLHLLFLMGLTWTKHQILYTLNHEILHTGGKGQ